MAPKKNLNKKKSKFQQEETEIYLEPSVDEVISEFKDEKKWLCLHEKIYCLSDLGLIDPMHAKTSI